MVEGVLFFSSGTFIVYHLCLDDSVPVRLCAVNLTHPELLPIEPLSVKEAPHPQACNVYAAVPLVK